MERPAPRIEPKPHRLRDTAREWIDIARGRLEIETPEPTLKDRLYTGSAKLAGHIASKTIKHIQDFDHALTEATGITITKPVKERALPALKYSYKAARWIAPRVARYARPAITGASAKARDLLRKARGWSSG